MSSAASPPSSSPVLGRKGTCRLCFDDGGELIQPCLCSGSSKWIHRDCLNRWRTTGANIRSMTNCPSCAFQYRLKLQRIMSTPSEDRARRFKRQLAAQTVGGFLLVQLVIILLGALIRLIDQDEYLVTLFNFPQDPGVEGAGDFLDAVRHHKLTYYVAGVLALLALIGFGVIVFMLVQCCSRNFSRGGQSRRSDCENCLDTIRCLDVCCDCYRVCCCPTVRYDPVLGYRSGNSPCYDCVVACEDCGHCCTDCKCSDTKDCCPNSNSNSDNPLAAVMAIAFLVIVIAFIFIGLCAAVMALVTAVQKAVQKYSQLSQLRVLSEEYVVEDLADPADMGEEPDMPAQQKMSDPDLASVADLPKERSQQQQALQRQITHEINEILGEFVPNSQQALHGYGSTSQV